MNIWPHRAQRSIHHFETVSWVCSVRSSKWELFSSYQTTFTTKEDVYRANVTARCDDERYSYSYEDTIDLYILPRCHEYEPVKVRRTPFSCGDVVDGCSSAERKRFLYEKMPTSTFVEFSE